MTTPLTPEDERITELLAPLADIPPVPHRERRRAARRPWLRPALVAVACLTVVVAAGSAIVTSGGGTSEPAGTAPPATVPAAADLGVYFLQGGELVRVAVPDTVGGEDAARRALEALLAGPPAGYESAVVPGTTIESFAVADTIATIKLSGRTPVDRGLEQIVATLTDFDDINWVRFGVEEGLVDRTLASGAVDAAPPIELVRAESTGQTITFAGTADTFEANVQLRVVQGAKELASTFVTATCGSGCRGSFEGTIDVPTGTAPEDVRLEAFTSSAEDGSIQNVVGRDVEPAP
jgi:hypothetical protein